MTLLPRDLARSRDKLKPSYIQYQSAYGHHTWQDGDLPWQDPSYKVTQPSGQVV